MILSLVACLAVSTAAHIPPIAKIGGIVLGQTTIEQFERKHGKGLAFPGGMTKSGRLCWYDATSGAGLDADGFYRSKDGRVIHDLVISFEKPGLKSFSVPASPGTTKTLNIPVIHLTTSELGILARLHKGMTKHDVGILLSARLDNQDIVVQPGNLEYPYDLAFIGQGPGQPLRRFTRWMLSCTFTPSNVRPTVLTALSVRAY